MVEKLSAADEKVLTRIDVDRGCIIVGGGLSGLRAGRKIASIGVLDVTRKGLFRRTPLL
jgi:heterodisulfide reductase subunit A-like polyferredoxin